MPRVLLILIVCLCCLAATGLITAVPSPFDVATPGDDPNQPDWIVLDTVVGHPPNQVVLPIRIANDEPLIAMEVTLTPDHPGLTLDSVSYVGSLVEGISFAGYTQDTGLAFTCFVYVSEEDVLVPGYGPLAFAYFSFDQSAVGDTFHFDTTTVVIDVIERTTLLEDEEFIEFTPQFIGSYITINSSCCEGVTGNVDTSGDGVVDIGDLTALITYLFIDFSYVLQCPEEANVDNSDDGVIDIADLTHLIGFLFLSETGYPLPRCP